MWTLFFKTTDIKILTICVSSLRNFSLKHKSLGIYSFYCLTHVCKKLGCTSKYSTWGRRKSQKFVTKAWHFGRFLRFRLALSCRKIPWLLVTFILNLPDYRYFTLDSSPNFSKICIRNPWDNEKVSANSGNNWAKGRCAIWDSKSLVGIFWISRFLIVVLVQYSDFVLYPVGRCLIVTSRVLLPVIVCCANRAFYGDYTFAILNEAWTLSTGILQPQSDTE